MGTKPQNNGNLWRSILLKANQEVGQRSRYCGCMPRSSPDLIDRENVFLDEVEIVILDEADRMADMGFTEPVCQILEECSPKRQTIMFSATLDEEVADIRDKYQSAPQIIEIGPEEVSVTEMNHHFWLMPNSMKSRVSAEAIRKSGRDSYSAALELVLKELQTRWKQKAYV